MPRLLLLVAKVLRGLAGAGLVVVGALLLSAGWANSRSYAPAVARWAPDSATVQVAAGPVYARGAGWQWLWGAHHRAVWATPITAPVLRLATGRRDSLLPLRAGGSYQSRTLRLRVASGHQFVLRSVDKDARAALPAGWVRRLLGGLMRDQTSAALPYGAYVAARLADAAGVFHTNPRLVYLPDDPGLGKFRAGYANALYLLEERAEGDQRRAPGFGRSPAVVSTARLLAELRRRPAAQADARAYLRARLLDLLLGDWSRREDQWRWASFPRPGSGPAFRPIPRDRDQAFFAFDDGFFPWLIAGFVPKYQSFHAGFGPGSVAGLGITARALDRTLLAPLGADDFRREADSLGRRLSDAALAAALAAGPPETRAALAARLGPALRARRAQLPAVARQYFRLLAAEAWVVGTDAPERFVLRAAAGGGLRVRVLARRPTGPDSLVSARTYRPASTRRVELYGLGGDDVFEVRGPLPAGVAVHLYGGNGRNQVRTEATGLATVTWHGTNPGPARLPPGISSVPDPHPELTANGLAWLRRYNLRD